MYTSEELLDSIIEEMYGLFKALISGNYAGFCTLFSDMISKMAALRTGLKNDKAAKDKQIEDLKAQIQRMASEPEPGGTSLGGETTVYNYGPTTNEGGK
ncbi:MAG: hypothetical protein J6Q14_01180 [Oscillospiraceae bacterium]|nr:hypothetical protein [Oscillospiraceae bacterium]